MTSDFSLILFSKTPAFIHQAVAAGVNGILIDWENIGKEVRQVSADTQINYDTVDDLRQVRKTTDVKVICRINRVELMREGEIEEAIAGGADEILIPMIRSTKEVEKVLKKVGGRCGVGAMVETLAAVEISHQLAKLPLSRVYVGLNDLGIDRKTPNIFSALVDGTLERIRSFFNVPFGFGGLTLPDRGFPIPSHLLMGEMARLGCQFSFLRRSFYRDTQAEDVTSAVSKILEALQIKKIRNATEVDEDRLGLISAVQAYSSDLSKS